MLEMSAREKFLFDVQGFLVVKGLLTSEEVDQLNRAVDANRDLVHVDSNQNIGASTTLRGTGKRMMLSDLLTLPNSSCEPFRSLLAHPRMVPYLNTMLGPGWKLDHAPAIFMAEPGAEGLRLHGATAAASEIFDVNAVQSDHSEFAGRAPDFARTYQYANGAMRCGLLAVEFNLVSHNEGEGGFCAIPGSHKANFKVPEAIQLWEEDREIVRNPAADAGDVIIFNEATVHGTLPWTADHERRSVLYRYSPRYLHYAGGYASTTLPAWVDELTDAQRAVLEPAHVYQRPVIQDDGSTVLIEQRANR